MRKSITIVVSSLALIVCVAGCAKQDDTMSEAPPPKADAKGLPNAAGQKKSFGGPGTGDKGAAKPTVQMRKN